MANNVEINNNIQFSDLDYTTIRNNIKRYLQNQQEFTDYDFEGSAMSTMLDILTTYSVYNGFYINFDINESFLDSAQVRNNIVSRAKELDYVPRSTTSAKATISFTANGEKFDSSLTFITIDQYTKFSTTIDGNDYTFCTTEDVIVYKDDTTGNFTDTNVIITEGEPISYEFLFQGGNERFIIPSPNIDTSTLEIIVSPLSGDDIAYTLAGDINTITGNDAVYWIQENEEFNYEIYFGNDVVGKKPSVGSTITCNYLNSSGNTANKASVFTLVDSVQNVTDGITITTVTAASSGAERETIDSIKFLAPKTYEAQERCVTTADYEAILRKYYTNIDTISVWGGEDHDPITYGKVYISIKPVYGFVLADTEKEYIKTNILKSRNVVTITPEIIDPEYIYLIISSVVKYNPIVTTKTSSQIKTNVIDAINLYNDTYLGEFDQYFRYSNLISIIDEVDTSITNNLTTVQMKIEFIPTLNVYERTELNFNNAIKYYNASYTSLTSTKFVWVGPTGTEYTNCIIEDVGGILYVKQQNYYTGVKTIVSDAVGTVNYTTGKVIIETPFKVSSFTDSAIGIIVTPDSNDIKPIRNQLLYVKPADITVVMQDDTESN